MIDPKADLPGTNHIASAYSAFRGSKWFLFALIGVVGSWLGWNICPIVPHFDGNDFGKLNLLLSIEASLSVALLIMAGHRNDYIQKKQLESLMHMMQSNLVLLQEAKKHDQLTKEQLEQLMETARSSDNPANTVLD